jgi:hypothetical protein
MIILADRPGVMTDLVSALGCCADWRPANDLDPPTQQIWRTLAGQVPGWALHLTPASPAIGYWSRLVLVSEAQRSQFDALRDALAPAAADVGLLPRSRCRAATSMATTAGSGAPRRATCT